MKYKVKSILRKLHLISILKWIRVRFIMLIDRPKWKALISKENLLLELGSGPKKGVNGWVTVDIFGADITHDLKHGIPLPDAVVDKIYTSHMLEHIPYKELKVFIHECHRVLKVGGELSVCVPNAALFIEAYVNRFEFAQKESLYQSALVNTDSFMDQVNYIAYMDGEHHYMFDSENLVNTLKSSPFSEVSLRNFDDRIDLRIRKSQSIYASAFK